MSGQIVTVYDVLCFFRDIKRYKSMMIKLKINGYSFGRMIVGEREFTSDLILHSDGRIQDNWWRSQGHSLLPDYSAQIS
jgi:hypothetical protein